MIINDCNMSAAINIAKFANDNSEFYKQKYSSINISNYYNIPYLTQEEISKNSMKMKTNYDLFRTSISSGTTGTPKILFRTKKDFETSVKNQVILMKQCGIKQGDVVGILQPFGLCAYGDLTLEACKELNVLAIPIGTIDDAFSIDYIKKLGVNVLDIAPSKLNSLLDISSEKSIKLNLKFIMSAGEALSDSLIKKVKSQFKCEIFNQYGTEEVDGLAGATEPGIHMSLLEDSFLFELINTHRISNTSIIGELVVTSLYHTATPMIKYSIGDIVEWNEKTREITVKGRSCEFYNIYDSVKLYPFHIEEFFKINNFNITDWQCKKETKGNLCYLHFSIKPSNPSSINLIEISDKFKNINPEIYSLIDSGTLVIDFNLENSILNCNKRKRIRFL